MTEQPTQYDSYLKALDEYFAKARAYNSTVVAIGYGSFFALWSFMWQRIPPVVSDVVATMLALSAITFVGWEVYRMWAQVTLEQEIQTRNAESPQHEQVQLIRAALTKHEKRTAVPYALSFGFAVVSGFGAGLILTITFIWGLITHTLY